MTLDKEHVKRLLHHVRKDVDKAEHYLHHDDKDLSCLSLYQAKFTLEAIINDLEV